MMLLSRTLGRTIAVTAAFLVLASSGGRSQVCESLQYYNPSGAEHVYTSALPTVWWGLRVSPTLPFAATVDSALIGFGIQKNNTAFIYDTLEVRVLRDTLPMIQILDSYVAGIPATGGQVPDTYWVVEFDFTPPMATIPAGRSFWIAWRLRGPAVDVARILMRKPAANPSRSVVINPNGTTQTVTQFLASSTFQDSVDLYAEAHVCYPGAPPVELVSFRARWENEQGVLEWNTATETNNLGFEVQRLADRSRDGRFAVWQRLGFVPGSGTSTSERTYRFVDAQPRVVMDEHGIVRYRLCQVDYDGTVTHSPVAELHVPFTAGGCTLEAVRPNPLRRADGIGRTVFTLASPRHVRIDLYDVLGRHVGLLCEGDFPAGVHEAAIDPKTLAPGSYLVVLAVDDARLSRRVCIPD
ncbi:MAG: T9SS type A sorting domain-containing protein [Bacteroidota bacterium]|nr:T9SS type A sorting domain-containing protein [Bacteroidota bacterium]